MNEVEQAQAELIEEFAFFEDWMDRYQYLIDMGRRLPELPEADRSEANRIRGCQSQVWFVSEERDGRLYFRAISEAAVFPKLPVPETWDPGSAVDAMKAASPANEIVHIQNQRARSASRTSLDAIVPTRDQSIRSDSGATALYATDVIATPPDRRR